MRAKQRTVKWKAAAFGRNPGRGPLDIGFYVSHSGIMAFIRFLRPPAAAFHLPVRSFARTGEEEGAGELAGGWSSNPSCPEGHILLKTPLHFSQKSVGHFLFPFIYPPSPLFTLFLRLTNRLTAK